MGKKAELRLDIGVLQHQIQGIQEVILKQNKLIDEIRLCISSFLNPVVKTKRPAGRSKKGA